MAPGHPILPGQKEKPQREKKSVENQVTCNVRFPNQYYCYSIKECCRSLINIGTVNSCKRSQVCQILD